MGVYNLYLLDETRDPKVIARLARVTGLSERIVRREALHPPFLLLREHGLSSAVAIRRDFEQMGLTLRLELVEHPSGEKGHPLAGEQAPDDGSEIVLEEGAGFRASTEAVEVPGRALRTRPPGRVRRRRLWLGLLLACLLALAGWSWLGRGAASNPATLARRQVESLLPDLQARMDRQLTQPDASPISRDSLWREAVALELQARPFWDQLPEKLRGQLERLTAGRQTLELRRERERNAGAAPPRLAQSLAFFPGGAPPEAFWNELSTEWNRRVAPAGLGEQLALESLTRRAEQVRQGEDRPARLRLDRLEKQDPAALERLQARSLAGSLRQKGVAWTGRDGARQGWADLPDSTVLDVAAASGQVHLARVLQGRLVFDELPGELRGVSVRLAALELQPKGVRRILEAGLRLFAPEVYFATLPGSSLPRLNPAAAEELWQRGGDPALKAELARLGFRRGDLLKPVLERDQDLPGGEEDLLDWLRAAAARYEKAQVWPQVLELRTPSGRFRVSGCELWHLTRS